MSTQQPRPGSETVSAVPAIAHRQHGRSPPVNATYSAKLQALSEPSASGRTRGSKLLPLSGPLPKVADSAISSHQTNVRFSDQLPRSRPTGIHPSPSVTAIYGHRPSSSGPAGSFLGDFRTPRGVRNSSRNRNGPDWRVRQRQADACSWRLPTADLASTHRLRCADIGTSDASRRWRPSDRPCPPRNPQPVETAQQATWRPARDTKSGASCAHRTTANAHRGRNGHPSAGRSARKASASQRA
jgi:hypothetical protein